jgi:preprotein translocase subunit SecD
MIIRAVRFNLYFWGLVLALTGAGCISSKDREDKFPATLRIHLETNPLPLDQSERILVLRSAPMAVTVEKNPFLNESQISEAAVVETTEGFKLLVQFNRQGTWLLEQYTSANSHRRIAIRSQFRISTNVFDRWIAAPLVQYRITDGMLSFTPDADRTEAEAIARGLNNVAKKVQPKKDPFNEKKPLKSN